MSGSTPAVTASKARPDARGGGLPAQPGKAGAEIRLGERRRRQGEEDPEE